MKFSLSPGACQYHSDQGVQYASGDYLAELKSHGFPVSMARAGSPYGNANLSMGNKSKF